MKKHRFKLKPAPTPRTVAAAPAPSPAAEPPRPAGPDLAAAFAEAIETLRRNLHCDRPAAQNQAAFLLYRIYSQEVRLPALEDGLRSIEANLGLAGSGRSLSARLRQIERATARLRETDERPETEPAAPLKRAQPLTPPEASAPISAPRPSPPAGQRCLLTTAALDGITEQEICATTRLPPAESRERDSVQDGRLPGGAPHPVRRAAADEFVDESERPGASPEGGPRALKAPVEKDSRPRAPDTIYLGNTSGSVLLPLPRAGSNSSGSRSDLVSAGPPPLPVDDDPDLSYRWT